MRLLLTFSAVLYSIDGAELIQLVTAFFIAVALFIHQTKDTPKG